MVTQLVLAPNVSLRGLQAPLLIGLQALQAIASKIGIEELVLTSVTDGKHSVKSLHYVGAACDIRSKTLAKEQKQALLLAFNSQMGRQFDFIIEDVGLSNEHFHLEHDEHA